MADQKCDTGAYSQSIWFTGPNSGRYTWFINDKSLISDILNAENGKFFESKPFVMRHMRWTILIYPNGDRPEYKGSIIIYLKLLSIPQTIDTVMLWYSISCDKTFSAYSNIHNYTQTNDRFGVPDKSLLLSEWKAMNADTLSITVNINVIKIIMNKTHMDKSESIGLLPHFWINKKRVLVPKKWHFEYKFDSNTINRFKMSNVGKCFESNIIDNTWQLLIYPNGQIREEKGNIGVYLSLCSFPPNIAEISVNYGIKCCETGHNVRFKDSTFNAHSSGKGHSKFIPKSKLFSLKQLTFIVSIKILNMKKEENIECIISDPAIIDRIFSFHSCDNINGVIQQLTEKEKKIQELSCKVTSLQNAINDNRVEKDKIVQELRNKMNAMESYVFGEKQEHEENVTSSILLLQEKIKEIQKDRENKKEHLKMNEKAGQKELKSWLINLVKLPQYFDIFVEEGFEDLQSVKFVTANELTSMGITKIAHKMKLLRFVAKLNHDNQPNEGN